MARIELLGAFLASGLFAAADPPVATAQATGSGASAAPAPAGKDGEGSGGDPTKVPAAASSGWGWWGYRPYVVVRGTPNGSVATIHSPLGGMSGGFGFWTQPPSAGPAAPAPPPGLVRPAAMSRPTIKIKQADLDRADRLVTYGDRLFRVANLKRAEERYEQAIRLNPHWATPRLRLAQIALVRGRYTLAADLLREAETAEPGWIVTAKDVQALYSEPAEFARHVSRLEEHLHQHPEDRDAWLVLGAQWFLSRRENKAADVFLRLDDPRRKPDVALAAFLDAARLREAPRTDPDPGPGRDPLAPPAP
ncbi:tetratricopeptide repeat protein [Paludisphaera soli]|uniref:tetratricopeptide repeat protein n=1 Tax=Paludisphaera soli TaxID=2712865 RepID=UPI0013EC00E8|nr:tetratricopeptide repeat protein [Paludisphaera soli]